MVERRPNLPARAAHPRYAVTCVAPVNAKGDLSSLRIAARHVHAWVVAAHLAARGRGVQQQRGREPSRTRGSSAPGAAATWR